MKEFGINCAKTSLKPFNFRGKYYNFLDEPIEFMEKK